MAQYDDTGFKTLLASAAIAKYARVILSAANTCTKAGLAERGIGVAMNAAFAALDPVRVKLWTAAGTFPAVASEALAVAAVLYTESEGEVQDTAQATAYKCGTAFTAAAADQDIIEMIPIPFDETAAT